MFKPATANLSTIHDDMSFVFSIKDIKEAVRESSSNISQIIINCENLYLSYHFLMRN